MEQLKTVWTFCVLLPRRKLFQSWDKAYGTIVKEIISLEGIVAVTLLKNRAILILMNTENDCIVAKNRLKYSGIMVSEETYPADIDWKNDRFYLKEEL